MFDEKISNFSTLNVCKVVDGNLELDDNVAGSVAGNNLAKIKGDVKLGNAKQSQLMFLTNTTITGTVCEFPFSVSSLFSHFQPVMIALFPRIFTILRLLLRRVLQRPRRPQRRRRQLNRLLQRLQCPLPGSAQFLKARELPHKARTTQSSLFYFLA